MLSCYSYIVDAVKTGFLENHNYVRAFVQETEEKIHTCDTKLFPLGKKGRLTEYIAVIVKGHKKREILWCKVPADDVFCETDKVPCLKKDRFIFSEMGKWKMREILLKRVIYQVDHNYAE